MVCRKMLIMEIYAKFSRLHCLADENLHFFGRIIRILWSSLRRNRRCEFRK